MCDVWAGGRRCLRRPRRGCEDVATWLHNPLPWPTPGGSLSRRDVQGVGRTLADLILARRQWHCWLNGSPPAPRGRPDGESTAGQT